MSSIYEGKIIALKPVYLKGKGDVTYLYKEGEEVIIIEKSIRTCLKNMCKYYMVDYKEAMKNSRGCLYSSNLIPIPLSNKDIFTPFKTRESRVKNDCAYSYINYNYIESIEEIESIKEGQKKKIAVVCMKNKMKFPCICKKCTADKHYKDASLINNILFHIGM